MSERAAGQPGATIPMTVLGGYLGAGKTTLLNAVLSQAGGTRIAVVVNDFGAIDIDASLVRARSGDTIELANGCICCDLADGMAAAMERVRAMEPAPDHVLVEVSGVGDPAAVAAWSDHPGFRRGGVLVCADAETVREKALDRWVCDTVLAQLRSADLLLVTKSDLVEPVELGRVREWLAELAPGVPTVDARATGAFELISPTLGKAGAVADRPAGDHARHQSWSAETSAVVDAARLRAFVAGLPSAVVRAKGVLRTSSAPDRRTVFQLVGRRREFTDDGPWTDAGTPSRMVVIAVECQLPGEDRQGREIGEALRQLMC